MQNSIYKSYLPQYHTIIMLLLECNCQVTVTWILPTLSPLLSILTHVLCLMLSCSLSPPQPYAVTAVGMVSAHAPTCALARLVTLPQPVGPNPVSPPLHKRPHENCFLKTKPQSQLMTFLLWDHFTGIPLVRKWEMNNVDSTEQHPDQKKLKKPTFAFCVDEDHRS